MTTSEGLNLAGVETVLEMEATVERMRAEMARMRKRAAEMEQRMNEELERLRAASGGEIVPYGAYEPAEPGGGEGRARSRCRSPPQARPQRRKLGQGAGQRSGCAAASASSRLGDPLDRAVAGRRPGERSVRTASPIRCPERWRSSAAWWVTGPLFSVVPAGASRP